MTAGIHGSTRLAKTAAELKLPLDDVVILFACNELFVPYLSVALQSISEHANPGRRYDVVVLSNSLSDTSMCTLHDQVTRDNFGIGFLDAMAALGDIKLPRHGHFACETYYRLLAPEMLVDVDKAIYMDSDLVALCDLAELYDTDVTGCLLAATRDADTAGQCAGYDAAILSYLRDEVGLKEPYDYFQAGVLVMNLKEFRKRHSAGTSIEIAASKHWHWLDQDVLNLLAQGDYRRLDTSWNTLMDWQHLRRSHIVAQAPERIQAEYDTARANPRVVHYAGPDDRPWLYPRCDMGEYFWDFASRSPYHDELQRRLRASWRTPCGLLKRLQVFALFKIGMPAVDIVLPPGTRRRAAIISAYKKLGGNLL